MPTIFSFNGADATSLLHKVERYQRLLYRKTRSRHHEHKKTVQTVAVNVEQESDDEQQIDDDEQQSDDDEQQIDDNEQQSDDDEQQNDDNEQQSDDDEQQIDDNEQQSDDDEQQIDDDEQQNDIGERDIIKKIFSEVQCINYTLFSLFYSMCII